MDSPLFLIVGTTILKKGGSVTSLVFIPWAPFIPWASSLWGLFINNRRATVFRRHIGFRDRVVVSRGRILRRLL